MSRVKNMTQGNPVKLILLFALPLIVSNIGQQLYLIVDAIIVGRGVGVKALAAVGATDWINWLMFSPVYAFAQGVMTFTAQSFGQRNTERLNKVLVLAVEIGVCASVVLTVGGLLMVRPFLQLLKTPADIFEDAALYLSTMIAGMVIVMAYNVGASILRAFGDGKTPLVAIGIAAVLNIALDLLFVMVFHWGIFGAAIASLISQLVSFLYCLLRLTQVEYVKIKRAYWKPDWHLAGEMIRFSLPLVLQWTIIHLGGMILQSTINLQGSAFLAGYSANNKLYGLLESSAISLGHATTTFGAQNFGAGNKERVKAGLRASVCIAVVMAVCVATITALFGDTLIGLFINKAEADAMVSIEVAGKYLMVMSCCLPLLYLLYSYRSILQAVGKPFSSMLSGMAEFVVRVAAAKLVVPAVGAGFLFAVEPMAWLGALLLLIICYYAVKPKVLG